MLLSRLRRAGETPQAAGSRLVGKVHESAATTGNLTSPHAPELKCPVIAATNVGLSRQPAQVAPPQLHGGGRAEEGEAKTIRRGRRSNKLPSLEGRGEKYVYDKKSHHRSLPPSFRPWSVRRRHAILRLHGPVHEDTFEIQNVFYQAVTTSIFVIEKISW